MYATNIQSLSLGLATTLLSGLVWLPGPAAAEPNAANHPLSLPWRETTDLPAVQSPIMLTVDSPSPLEGVLWQLTTYTNADGDTVPAQTYGNQGPAVQFKDGQITGNATCNRFFGPYQLDGSALTIDAGGATLMACPDDFMAQEQAILESLGDVASYSITAGELRLMNADGATLLTLREVVSTSLQGTSWELTAFNNGRGGVTSLINDTSITLMIEDDDTLYGFAGCNNYRAGYDLSGNAISIGPAASTRKLCAEPEGLMEQEAAYLQALEMAETYLIEGNILTFETNDGATVARFVAAEDRGSR